MREGVDDRDVRVMGEGGHLLVIDGPDDDGVDEPREDAGGVLDRLPAPQLHVASRQYHRVPAEARDAHLE